MATQSARQLVANQRRSLMSMKRKLIDMASVWGDVDQYNLKALEEMAEKAQEVADNLADPNQLED